MRVNLPGTFQIEDPNHVPLRSFCFIIEYGKTFITSSSSSLPTFLLLLFLKKKERKKEEYGDDEQIQTSPKRIEKKKNTPGIVLDIIMFYFTRLLGLLTSR